jgi:beta-lactamase regulating signal transducer with metallopeptidase domain
MTQVAEWLMWIAESLVQLGELGFWWYVLPLLVWTLLGYLVVGTLRLVPRSTPSSRLCFLQALLFSLPAGMILVVIAGEALSGSPIAEARKVVAIWARSDLLPATETISLPSEDTQLPPYRALTFLASYYFWVGFLSVGALFLTLKRIGGLAGEAWALGRLRRSLSPVPVETRVQIITPLEQQLGLAGRQIEYRVAPTRAVPITFGWWRPIVVLPRLLFNDDSSARSELRMTLLHELTHVRRRDYLARWTERIVDALFAASPLTRHLVHSIGRCRELICDQSVVQKTNAPAEYASLLVRMGATSCAGSGSPLSALQMRGPSSFLKERLTAMERFSREPPSQSAAPRPSTRILSLGVLTLVATAVFLAACSEQVMTSDPPPAPEKAAQGLPSAEPAQPTEDGEPPMEVVVRHYALYYEAYKHEEYQKAIPDLRWILENAPLAPRNDDRNLVRAVTLYTELWHRASSDAEKHAYADTLSMIVDQATHLRNTTDATFVDDWDAISDWRSE